MKTMTDDCAQEGTAGRRKASAEARLSPPGGRPRLPAGSGGAVGLTEAGPPRLRAGQAGIREGCAAGHEARRQPDDVAAAWRGVGGEGGPGTFVGGTLRRRGAPCSRRRRGCRARPGATGRARSAARPWQGGASTGTASKAVSRGLSAATARGGGRAGEDRAALPGAIEIERPFRLADRQSRLNGSAGWARRGSGRAQPAGTGRGSASQLSARKLGGPGNRAAFRKARADRSAGSAVAGGGAIPRPSCDPVTVEHESGGLEAVPGERVSAVSAAPGARQAARRIARRRRAEAA